MTGQTTISINGKEVPYNQYLVSMGAAVDVEAEQEETDPGSFVKYVHLAYPGQNQTVQDGGTEKRTGSGFGTGDPAAGTHYQTHFPVFL